MLNRTLVLLATVSDHEREGLLRQLNELGHARFVLQVAPNAPECRKAIDAHPGRCALVIDAGLLCATHDPQWRELMKDLGGSTVIIRALKKEGPPDSADGRDGRWWVDPDDRETLQAILRSVPMPRDASAHRCACASHAPAAASQAVPRSS